MMLTINIKNLKLFGFHGVYEEEKLLGGDFEINISLKLKSNHQILKLNDTLNYVTVFEIVKTVFDKPELLIETVANNIIEKVSTLSNSLFEINLSIDKLNPPIQNFEGKVGINIIKTF